MKDNVKMSVNPESNLGNNAANVEDALARRCVDLLWSGDYASQSVGMEIADVRAGRVELTMRIRENMVNGHRFCHGGLIFMLADTAFAFACNSRNESSVPMNCSIDFVKPALLGDILTAVAEERTITNRTGVLDVTVNKQDGRAVAHFRGRSSSLGKTLVEE